MNNKSSKREFRIMDDDSYSWPYYIQFRYLNWRKVFGWETYLTSFSEDNYPKTFSKKEDAIACVESLIRYDNYVVPKTTIKQVWPEEEETRRQM